MTNWLGFLVVAVIMLAYGFALVCFTSLCRGCWPWEMGRRSDIDVWERRGVIDHETAERWRTRHAAEKSTPS